MNRSHKDACATNRRHFVNRSFVGLASLAVASNGLIASEEHAEEHAEEHVDAFSQSSSASHSNERFLELTKSLLVDWCDGMIRRQVNNPSDPSRHGALICPACSHIHGRCSDALYPFMHLARVTGEQKYLDAAINVYDWAENNVSQPDGSWTNDINPKAWRGTTIFGAIALAEALHYHGELLDATRREAWTKRLDEAVGGYLYRDFRKIDFTNLNYGMTGVYGFHLFGNLLGNPKYTARSDQFAKRVKEFFTDPNMLLWGEGKPNDNRSGRGLLPVDLGYNVEESLNGVVLYAIEVGDQEMLDLATKTLNGHLEFMLPDGAWDNSWGTRSQKWSYWGSRTSDGCQPAFSLMAGYNPAFGTAAIRNAELLQRCTADGLLHGGPDYVSHGIKPCIHHTFAHAKVMALVQDRAATLPKVDDTAPLPRAVADGVKHFSELDVWLAARGPWRATISAYDSIYKTKKSGLLQQPTGGSLSVLYHEKVGTLLASSMARYEMVEPLNMQPQPGRDFPLTTRVERHVDGSWFTNLYELDAKVSTEEDGENVEIRVETFLENESRELISEGEAPWQIQYRFGPDNATIIVEAPEQVSPGDDSLIVPILSPAGEEVRQVSDTRIEVVKPKGTVVIESNATLSVQGDPTKRVFNMVPGAEALPLEIKIPAGNDLATRCVISVI
ncbi:hypothetical protein [Rhodopirellula sallentina]|uniref:Putative secreted protein n=1 Tax=Rhodopirellula sallentina SM41 TaxID=1263870 RepID=M5U7P1_9BACT|nr:hypothetical protein [Rhodopirellula sallentina]EMI57279.1 putative secreted protein [Rhodopirellula sallentina SM41]